MHGLLGTLGYERPFRSPSGEAASGGPGSPDQTLSEKYALVASAQGRYPAVPSFVPTTMGLCSKPSLTDPPDLPSFTWFPLMLLEMLHFQERSLSCTLGLVLLI